MGLSYREKQLFYEQLGQLLRAGFAIGPALEKLRPASRGSVAAWIRSLQRELDHGASLTEGFRLARPALSEMEQATLGGLSRAGQLESGLHQLSAYFGALHAARQEVQRRLLYPLFLLHFGVLSLNAPLLVTGTVQDYLRATGKIFAVVYGVLLLAGVLIHFLRDAGRFVASVDVFLRLLPFLGKVRRAFAVSRFCATYNMQLEAGVNVVDSLRAAAQASQSGLIRVAVLRALPEVRRGEKPGEQLAQSPSAFPHELMSRFVVAEETGRLDQTLTQLAGEQQAEAFRRLKVASEWIPRLFYVGILIYFGWQVVSFYTGYWRQLDSLMDDAMPK